MPKDKPNTRRARCRLLSPGGTHSTISSLSVTQQPIIEINLELIKDNHTHTHTHTHTRFYSHPHILIHHCHSKCPPLSPPSTSPSVSPTTTTPLPATRNGLARPETHSSNLLDPVQNADLVPRSTCCSSCSFPTALPFIYTFSFGAFAGCTELILLFPLGEPGFRSLPTTSSARLIPRTPPLPSRRHRQDPNAIEHG